VPIGITALDQLDLPRAAPFLDRLLAGDCIANVVEAFDMDQMCHAIALREARQLAFSVFADAIGQPGRDTDIKRAPLLAR
jgi:hypothetical protein